MNTIVKAQSEYFLSDVTKNINFRIEQLKKLKRVLLDNEKVFNDAIYKDFKKSEFDTRVTEFGMLYHDIDLACRKLKKWAKKKRVNTNFLNFPGKSYIIPEPLGVCFIIGAWNYPYQLAFGPVIAALAAGNTVVLKPSEIAPHTSTAMKNIINQNFDSRHFHVVEGGAEDTSKLLELKWDKIFFTGSTHVGKIVYQAAAKNLIPVTLELGGKSPTFITPSCDLKISVKRLVWGKFLNAGQTCIAPDYILVHKSIKTRFLNQVKIEIEKSEFSISNNNYVQMINDKNFQRVKNLIESDKVIIGGECNEEQRVISPTVLDNISFDDKVMQEEIFGPVLPIIEYEDLKTAVKTVKQFDKPLACYIFSSDHIEIDYILNSFSFGGGSINDTFAHMINPDLPFGGVGASGFGSYHGEHGFKDFSHFKSIVRRGTWFETSLKYFPHTKWKLNLIKKLLG